MTTTVRQNQNVMGSTNYSRKDIQSKAEDCDSWRLWVEGLISDITAVIKSWTKIILSYAFDETKREEKIKVSHENK